ncbi:SAM-dependent methyltransferase, partial [Shewanella sp. 0m-11]
FTAIANGNSRMYHSKTLLKLISQAGLFVDEDIDNIGLGHTLLRCKLKP